MRTAALRLVLVAATSLLGPTVSAEPGDRHRFDVEIDLGLVAATTPLTSWTTGGLGKLRYDESDDGLIGNRFAAEYHGRLTDAWTATAVVDYVDDASDGFGATEAYLQWRPVPSTPLQQQLRIGAFYPPLSLENAAHGWRSPYTISFSAINTWLGEETRAVGAEWSMRRALGRVGSPHQVGAFGSAFYANDPAGTLLFWRGFAIHDRQTRFSDRLPMPPRPAFGSTPGGDAPTPQSVEPLAEIDGDPGFYAGVEWRYARRAEVKLAVYDNRADPYAFSGGQWAWRTDFVHLAAQLDLPFELGLVGQWMRGRTDWVIAAGADGSLSPQSELVSDDFESSFVLLTRPLARGHRLTLRYDRFDMHRGDELVIDRGSAWTAAYRYDPRPRYGLVLEWLEIDSTRDVWETFYGMPRQASENRLRLQVTVRLGAGG